MKIPHPFPFALLLPLAAVSPAFAADATARPAPAPTTAAAPATPRGAAAGQTVAASRSLLIIPHASELSNEEAQLELRNRVKQIGATRAGLGDRSLDEWFHTTAGHDGLSFSVNFNAMFPPPPRLVAAEVADDIVALVRDYLGELRDRGRRDALARAARLLEMTAPPAKDAEERLKAMRHSLRELSGRSDIEPKTLTAALSSIDDEVQRLQLERLAKDARRKALEEEIAKAAERVQKNVEGDAIAIELKKVVDAREERARTVKKLYEQGAAPSAEVTQAIADAAESRAKLLQQQRDAAAAAGGTSLEAFNRELMTLAIDAREVDTKTKYLEERLPRLRQAVEMLDQYRELEQRAAETRDALRNAQREADEVRRRTEDTVPLRILIRQSENVAPQ